MKKMIVLLLLILCVTSMSQAAKVISVNFAERADQYVLADEVAGLPEYAAANFNNFNLATGSGPLADETGLPTGAAVSFASAGTWGDGGAGFATPDARLSRGYLDDGATTAPIGVDIQVTGVPFESYTVVVYHSSGDDNVNTNGFTDVTVNGETQGVETGERWGNIREWVIGTNCLVFTNVTGSTLDIEALERNGGQRGSICGFQIVSEEIVSDPVPVDGEEEVPLNSTIEWTAPSAYVPTEYKVYVDPNVLLVEAGDPAALVSTQTETTFATSTPLYGQTYYWRVDAVDPNEGNPVMNEGFVWSFTTEVHPSTLEPLLHAPGISIGNPSFEKATGWSAGTPDWFDTPPYSYSPFVNKAYQESIPAMTIYGNVLGTLETDGSHWQAIGEWQPDVDYVISWGVSKRPGWGDDGTLASLWRVDAASVPANPNNPSGETETLPSIGATKITETAVYKSGVDNLLVDVSETLNTGTGGSAGDKLLIQFVKGPGGSRGYFDMVRVNLPRDARSAWGPTPANETGDIPPSDPITVSWNQGVDPATNYQPVPEVAKYHVYFGTDPDNLAYQGETAVGSESMVIPASLMSEFMTHYWRVDQELDDTTIITGPTWSFTTSLSDRLIAHWKFEDNLNDEVDVLTAGPNGDWPGAMADPCFDAGLDGRAIRFFRGDDKYVTIPGSEDFFNFYGEGLTVSMWYKPDDYSGLGGYMGLMSKTGGQNADGWKLFEEAFYANQGASMRLDSLSVNPSGRLDDGNWHHLVITYDETAQVMTAYLDGEAYGTAEGAVSAGTPVQVVIGALTDSGSWQYRGLIDEVKIYSYAVSPLDIAIEYTGYIPGTEVCAGPDDPSLQYDFNGDCKVDIADFAILAENWTVCNLVPTCLP